MAATISEKLRGRTYEGDAIPYKPRPTPDEQSHNQTLFCSCCSIWENLSYPREVELTGFSEALLIAFGKMFLYTGLGDRVAYVSAALLR